MFKNYGFQNEYDFVELFNNKYLYELDDNSQTFLKELFGDVIDSNEKIKSWKNRIMQKTDIFIKYKNHMDREIFVKALKKYSNSKQKDLVKLMRYAKKLNIEKKVIEYMEVLL